MTTLTLVKSGKIHLPYDFEYYCPLSGTQRILTECNRMLNPTITETITGTLDDVDCSTCKKKYVPIYQVYLKKYGHLVSPIEMWVKKEMARLQAS